MHYMDYVLGAFCFAGRTMCVEKRSTKFLAADTEAAFFIVNIHLHWIDTEESLDLPPEKSSLGTGDQSEDF
jgi:hypothetical protein